MAFPATLVFIDCEYTGEHTHPTLVSVGMVALSGEELYVTLSDYDESQVSDWLQENVLSRIEKRLSVDGKNALLRVKTFLEQYSNGEPVAFVSAGKSTDLLLVWDLWKYDTPMEEQFHFSKHLPKFLRHRFHMDLDTLFICAGIDPALDREKFVGRTSDKKHNALFDAHIVRLCFLKLVCEYRVLPYFNFELP